MEGRVAATVKKLESPAKFTDTRSSQAYHDHGRDATSVLTYLRCDLTHQETDSQLLPETHTCSSATGSHDSDTNFATPPEQDQSANYLNKSPNMQEISTMSKKEKELLQQLEAQKAASTKLLEELATLKIQNQIELERQKQEQWTVAISKLKEIQEQSKSDHATQLDNITKLIQEATGTPSEDSGLVSKLKELLQAKSESEEEKRKREEEEAEKRRNRDMVLKVLEQQKQLQEQMTELTKLNLDEETKMLLNAQVPINPTPSTEDTTLTQSQLIEQLRKTLGTTETEDPQKAVLRQFLSKSNTINTTGGATTLKPQLLKQLTGENEDFSMAEWLARFNKQEQGELKLEIDEELKQKSSRSGMLDKATSNIQQKEVWPQKNLLEDWADEELSFNQMQFEHHVAGEARTIEMCTEPSQILGRLRLLQRLAYAKLRGYEWPLIWKMYAAILTSIEARENTWDSSFNRFESILYSRQNTARHVQRERDNKKWFCRDYNKPEGCTKPNLHRAPVGAAGIIRTVHHICATCYMKNKQENKHPEGHELCPHRN